MNKLSLPHGRITFYPVGEQDAYNVVKWRNLPEARQSFFTKSVVTPDTHAAFLRSRSPHDLVWVVRTEYAEPVGMTALHVDPATFSAEYGRLIIDPDYQGQGYAKEIEYLTLYAAFEWLRLDNLWLDAYTSNEAVISLHHKTGWQDVGVDLPGHTDIGGPVLHQVYQREWWHERRQDYATIYGVELPLWR